MNARIGRTVQGPLLGVMVPLQAGRTAMAGNGSRTGASQLARAIPLVWKPLAVLMLALWPHWGWMMRRLTDGSDEPWGILAIVTVLVLVARDRRQLVLPSRLALLASCVLAIAAAAALFVVPPIFAAAIALLSLAVFLAAALPHRPATPLATLLLLALPIIASLQFYLGYPLRALTAHAAAPLLQLASIEAHAAGASLAWRGGTVLVDPPCAGIGMLWVGSFVAALLSFLNGADARRTLVNGMVAAGLVLFANVLRNTVLFFPESGLVHWPDAMHRGVGLAAFALAVMPLVVFAHWRARSSVVRSARAQAGASGLGGASQSLARPSRRSFAATWMGQSRVGAVRLAPRARLRTFFVGACLAAAVLPVLDSFVARGAARTNEPDTAVATRTSVEWPTHFRGRPLTQLALSSLDARFAHRFPGAVARFTDGAQTLIVRRVDRPTRTLHPAADCFRGAGYAITVPSAQVDDTGVHWRCFVATRDGQRARVCERIVAQAVETPRGLDDTTARAWTDVSAWYWSALRSTGPWWAITWIAPIAGENA